MSLKCSWKFRWSVMQTYNLKRVQFDLFLYTVGLQPEALFQMWSHEPQSEGNNCVPATHWL